METKDNKILIIHKNCDKIVDKIKSNLTDITFDIHRSIVWKCCPQIDSQLLASDEELIGFESVVIIGASVDVLKEMNRKVRKNESNSVIKLIFADIYQTFVYLFADFGPNVKHLPIEEYLQTFGDNICHKISQTSDRSQNNTLLVSIISGVICGQLLSCGQQTEQLFCYEMKPKINSYVFETNRPIVVIGLGSLGFSIVRQLVQIGAKNLVLIDNDFVHKYNLRHLLFNESHIGLKKCDVVKEFVINYNKDINIETFDARAQQASIGFFEALSRDKGVVVSAVDNTETKRFLSKVCVNHILPWIDVGIDGHMFHIQPIVPHFTESYFTYSDPSDPDYPLCVLKSFPHIIEHCVQWSKTKFDNWFNKKPKRADNWIQCLHISRLIFEKFFNQKAKQLLFSLPLDHKTEDGEDFWSDKRSPKPIDFDLNNEFHKTFLNCCPKLIASVNGIQIPENTDICEVIKSLTIPEFVPNRDKIIITDSSVKLNPNDLTQEFNDQNHSFKPQKYSRDNENHLKFIFALANCRALMYGIENVSIKQIDKIHNNLIYCFGSTLSTASAKVSIELIKLFQMKSTSEENEFQNENNFYNLSDLSAIVVSKPTEPLKTKLSDLCYFTEWDQWLLYECDHMLTLEDVLNDLNVRSGAVCTMMVMDGKSIYLPELFPHHLKRKKQTIRDIISGFYNTIPLFVVFSVSFESESEDISGPNVKYIFSQSND